MIESSETFQTRPRGPGPVWNEPSWSR